MEDYILLFYIYPLEYPHQPWHAMGEVLEVEEEL